MPTYNTSHRTLTGESELQRYFATFVRKRRILKNNQRVILFVLQVMGSLILSYFSDTCWLT